MIGNPVIGVILVCLSQVVEAEVRRAAEVAETGANTGPKVATGVNAGASIVANTKVNLEVNGPKNAPVCPNSKVSKWKSHRRSESVRSKVQNFR